MRNIRGGAELLCGPHIVDTCPFSVGRLDRSSGDVSEC